MKWRRGGRRRSLLRLAQQARDHNAPYHGHEWECSECRYEVTVWSKKPEPAIPNCLLCRTADAMVESKTKMKMRRV